MNNNDIHDENIEEISPLDSILKELFFVQKRFGKDGKVFDTYKIKTMYDGADNAVPKEALGGDKSSNDTRIIPGRAWMRKSGFDEIPQMINIINGDMSLFGTRPISENIFKQLTDGQKRRRNQYKPGIFGGYAFFDKGRKAHKRTIRENQEVYLRLRYIKENEGKLSMVKFNTWIFKENIKAILYGVNR